LIVTVHQPEHLPWLGFFDKLRQADVFVLLDNVQFRKNYFQNRNRIRTQNGAGWVTIPVSTKGLLSQSIREVRIDNQTNPRWRQKVWSTIEQCYRPARYWNQHESFLRQIYEKEWTMLCELNEVFIRYVLDALSINVKILKASDIQAGGKGSELILNICRELNANTYLSGTSGKDYLDLNPFSAASIAIRFQEFHHPIYRQLHEPFLPCMSAIDLLFNYGPASRKVLEGVGVETLERVFT
jgi:hypothetical protein